MKKRKKPDNPIAKLADQIVRSLEKHSSPSQCTCCYNIYDEQFHERLFNDYFDDMVADVQSVIKENFVATLINMSRNTNPTARKKLADSLINFLADFQKDHQNGV